MREFTKVAPTIWRTKSFQALRSKDRDQFMYLFTGPNQTSAGCCHINPLYACADLNIKAAEYHLANDRLAAAGLIRIDRDTDEVFIQDWYKTNPPMNEKHKKGINKEITRIQSVELRDHCQTQLDISWNSLRARHLEAANERLGTDLRRLRP